MPRLPIIGGDYNTWGQVLNDYLLYDHSYNGEHFARVVLFRTSINANRGDVVYWDTTSLSLKPALADGSEKQKVRGMVFSLDTTSVVLFGISDTTSAVVPNTDYYLSDTTAGRITSVKPLSNIVKIGTGFTTNTLLINIDEVLAVDTSSYAPVRIFGTSYQPDVSNLVYVVVSSKYDVTSLGGTAVVIVRSDSTNPPSFQIAKTGIEGGLANQTETLTTSFIVRRGDYYKIDKTEVNGTVTTVDWVETALKA